MQEQVHGRGMHCASLDTGLYQDPGMGARFYIPGEVPLCFSLSDCDQNCFQGCTPSPDIINFLTSFQMLTKRTTQAFQAETLPLTIEEIPLCGQVVL